MLKNRPFLKLWLLGLLALLIAALVLEAFDSAVTARSSIYTVLFVVGVPITLLWFAVAAVAGTARAVDRSGERLLGSSWRRFWSGVGALLGALADGMSSAAKSQNAAQPGRKIDDGGPQNYHLRRADQERSVQRAVESAIRSSNKGP